MAAPGDSPKSKLRNKDGSTKSPGRGTTGTKRNESQITNKPQQQEPQLEGTFSDIAPVQQEINTDISQFLNTKQTFNQSLTGVTQTADGERKISLDGDNNVAYLKNDGSFVHEFSPRLPVGSRAPHPGNLMAGPGSIIFNHNHPQSVDNVASRHIYKKGKNQANPLNQAANMMFNHGGAKFGKFGQKHVLNKYGRPIIQNLNMSVAKGRHVPRKSSYL